MLSEIFWRVRHDCFLSGCLLRAASTGLIHRAPFNYRNLHVTLGRNTGFPPRLGYCYAIYWSKRNSVVLFDVHLCCRTPRRTLLRHIVDCPLGSIQARSSPDDMLLEFVHSTYLPLTFVYELDHQNEIEFLPAYTSYYLFILKTFLLKGSATPKQ